VSSGDARVVWRKIWFSEAQIAGAWTRDGAGARRGALWDVTFADRTGRAYGNHFELEGVSSDFETLSGFVPRSGVITGRAANRFSWYGHPGALVEQLSTFLVANPVWLYDEFPGTGTFEGNLTQTVNAALRGGWTLRGNVANAHQRFDARAYEGYRVVSGADTLDVAARHGLYGLWSATAGASTPNRALTLSADLSAGAAVIFAEGAEGRFRAATLASSWRPNVSLRIETSVVHQRITRASDGSRFSTATIPRIKTEYQLTRSVFLRWVGQYVAQDRTALIDASTGLPLLASPIGEQRFGPSLALLVNDFRNDFLFSYKPTPGTVLFVGYGASLTEPEAFTLQPSSLHRVSDGFFLKASYRYRL
jgi:hypothetical protein